MTYKGLADTVDSLDRAVRPPPHARSDKGAHKVVDYLTREEGRGEFWVRQRGPMWGGGGWLRRTEMGGEGSLALPAPSVATRCGRSGGFEFAAAVGGAFIRIGAPVCCPIASNSQEPSAVLFHKDPLVFIYYELVSSHQNFCLSPRTSVKLHRFLLHP